MRKYDQPVAARVKAADAKEAQNLARLTTMYFASAIIVGLFALLVLPNL